MANHAHHKCKHVLAFCERCDVPYCTACNREWGAYLWTNTLGQTWTSTDPFAWPTTIVSTGSGTSSYVAAATNHTHN